jgi:hypothetical protein
MTSCNILPYILTIVCIIIIVYIFKEYIQKYNLNTNIPEMYVLNQELMTTHDSLHKNKTDNPSQLFGLSAKDSDSSNLHFSAKFPVIVWMLWFQGWDNAPEIVLQVRDSWLFHNPDLDLRLLDDNNLKDYIDYELPKDAKLPARSDIIRIILLKKYGGIWADSTLLCLTPINKWIQNVEPCKFWMYHGKNGACTFITSQLILSYPNEYIITKWYDEVMNFWSIPRKDYEYNWMDLLFHELYNNDIKFKNLINEIPMAKCEPETIHNYLQDIVYEYYPQKIKEIISKKPFIIKLNHHGELKVNTNAWAMIEYAFIKK